MEVSSVRTRPPFEVVPVSRLPEGDADAIAGASLAPVVRFGDRVRFTTFTQVSNGSGMRIPDAAGCNVAEAAAYKVAR